jgi:site-specific DNA-methyltransferase (adenine-specific)
MALTSGTWKKQSFSIMQGDANQVVKTLPVIHDIVTSPPYFRKRKYGDSGMEMGNEKSVEDYVHNLVGVLNAVPLHHRGSVWVNVSDTRKPKGGLWMVPERFAMAMVDSGWHLVDNVIWAKVLDDNDGSAEGTCMIEPAHRRLNGNGWEYFYRFVRDPKTCFFDSCAVRIPRENCDIQGYLPNTLMRVVTSVNGRACHNVWRVPMGQTKYKHYAVFPEELVERPVAMTCPMRVSVDGITLVERVVEMVEYDEGRNSKRAIGKYKSLEGDYDADTSQMVSGRLDTGRTYVARKPETKAWIGIDGQPFTAGTVLDPFCGTGTTGVVALRLGRSFIGIDLYDEFREIAAERCHAVFKIMDGHGLDPWTLHA